MTRGGNNTSFKRAVYASLFAHVALFLLILVSPILPKSSKKEMVQYIPLSFVTPGGGGGGGSGGTPLKAAPPPVKKETLRDLTVPQKVKEETKPAMRYPAEKPKKEAQQKTEKKAAITKPEPSPADTANESAAAGGAGGEGSGMGTGLRIGTGTGTGGPGYGGSAGLSNFPYTYYLQIITDRVSANWFTSLVDPGVSGNFQTIILFRINRDGQVSDLKVEESSGMAPLDLSAMRAVKASAPFPPLPRDYDEAYLVIHLIFEHSK
jgi:TonB family protein